MKKEEELEQLAIKKLKEVYDPEIPIDIYSLGLIYKINFESTENEDFKCNIDMTLTSPACPVAGALVDEVEQTVSSIEGVEVAKVKLTFDPPWTMDMVSEEGKEVMQMEGAAIREIDPFV